MIDFHTHILPAIDDGSASVEESIEMLKKLVSVLIVSYSFLKEFRILYFSSVISSPSEIINSSFCTIPNVREIAANACSSDCFVRSSE